MQLSVIIVTHNSFHVLSRCLELLRQQLQASFSGPKEYEIIIVDNASIDETSSFLKKQKDIRSINISENVGFGRGNNAGADIARGDYLLLLNSDVYLDHLVDLQVLVSFLEQDQQRAALAIRLDTSDGLMDQACHRGFPTIFNSLIYFFGLERILGGSYHLTSKDLTKIHEINCPSAAFFLVKKKVFDAVQGFDPDYFFYAEDIDLCYRIKEKKYTIWFYPAYQAQHLKYQSGQNSADSGTRQASQAHFFSSMGLFYQKHYTKKYPFFITWIVQGAIAFLTFLKK